ncbi:hypothetical protein ASG01_04820 [Chryseobacterium sp. Leaf180]|uniref:hypothetical protein n=1 Tax=Chryseobacterium sp. Leaf180 TaxID=1736289 RepID=UPI0006FACD60|nr:hypothetical protein [Chryseobacterium sp. Leaf180]KQR95178.1 hypothetical protein ASG01_04820 [Chryseobacterium sp. Leaf180]
MKVYFISDILNEAKILIPEQVMTIVPRLDDHVDIIQYLKEDDKQVFKSYVEQNNKLELGRVTGRTWSKAESEDIVFINLLFIDV